MTAIKIFISLTALLLLVSCESEQVDGEALYNGPAFLRFYLIADDNNQPIENGDIVSGAQTLKEYNHESLKAIKIPVLLTHPNLKEAITVVFEVEVNSEFTHYTVLPTNQLNFNPTQLSDTITILIDKRWENESEINLRLVECSDENVLIGQPNNIFKNDVLTIHLDDLYTTYSFEKNRIEIEGVKGEAIEFNLLFDKGFIPSELSEIELFSEVKGFDYSLDYVINNNDLSKVKYTMTLNEDINNDEVTYITALTLNENSVYQPIGTSTLEIVKPLNIARDNAIFTSANFYNLNDPSYKIYGENWMWNIPNGICKWQAWSAFAFPVIVDKDHPSAILYTDNGTADEKDDIYHHAFRVGFNSKFPDRTTVNSFNLKRWFNNFKSSPQASPGFSIVEALEFYPKGGVSETEGAVSVVPQLITISNTDGKSYAISISGEGTYKEISSGLFEISLTFKAFNDELFGGTQISYYKMYNKASYGGDPDPLDIGCIEAVDM